MIRLVSSRQTFWSKSRDAILSLFQLITTGSFPFKKKLDYNKCPVTRFYHINLGVVDILFFYSVHYMKFPDTGQYTV